MSLIRISDLTFHYEGSYDNVFEHASVSFDTDWKLGFVGRNGRGKTTLLRLIMGELSHRGAIDTGGTRFEYFPCAPGDDSLTAEAVFSAVSSAPPWRFRREMNLLGVDEDAFERPFSTLSHGERAKVLLAALFSREGSFPLIDEPTNHLDMDARAAVSRYLAAQRGFLLVSHDRAFLDGCVDHILSINRASIEVQKGNFSSWEENRRRQDAFETAENERLSREIGALRQAARRASDWSDRIESTKIGTGAADRGYIGHQSARMMQRAKAIERRRERAAGEKEGLLKNVERADALKIHPLHHPARLLAEARGLTVAYGERVVCGPLDFSLAPGERLALLGKNGAGKSSVLKLFTGEAVPHAGTLRLASGLIVSSVPQDSSFLSGGVLDYARARALDATLFLTILRKLDFPRVQFEKDMASFSAGQKKKVLLAASLAEEAHLYVWDEPLNYIDVLSRMQIRDLLLEHRAAMLLVEHDRAFVDELATRVIRL